jgi:4-hydroxy-4-methyl-2-oxoglutarate aldolase
MTAEAGPAPESVIYRRIPRPDPAIVDALRDIPVADLHDELNAVDRKSRMLSHKVRPVIDGARIVGPAVTAFNTPGDNLMMHTALYYAQRGDVLVFSNGGMPNGSLWGENASMQAKRIGVAGVVVDGPVRDIDGIRRQGIPIWSSIISPTRPTKTMPGTVNVPISCGGVTVFPGDLIVADSDGVIVVPVGEALRIAEAARARIARDVRMQERIAAGSTLFQEIGCEAALQKIGAVIHDDVWRPSDR